MNKLSIADIDVTKYEKEQLLGGLKGISDYVLEMLYDSKDDTTPEIICLSIMLALAACKNMDDISDESLNNSCDECFKWMIEGADVPENLRGTNTEKYVTELMEALGLK